MPPTASKGALFLFLSAMFPMSYEVIQHCEGESSEAIMWSLCVDAFDIFSTILFIVRSYVVKSFIVVKHRRR